MRHLPNLICLLRIALIWPTLVALRAGDYPVALALFVAAAVSDGLTATSPSASAGLPIWGAS
jgi:hypothetical protein